MRFPKSTIMKDQQQYNHNDSSNFSIVDPSQDSSINALNHDDKHGKSWSFRHVYLQFRRMPFLAQCFFALCLLYLAYWLLFPFFLAPPPLSSDIIDHAIVVLGGGVTADGTLPKHTQLRIKEAVRLYHQLQGRARIFPLSGGTPYKPNPLDAKGFPIWEATAAARALLQESIPAEHIFEEAFSLDTIGNVRV